jgi:hypothetical protein
MPTILVIAGWRIFFCSNENNEPIHVHAEKAEMEIKFRIDVDNFEITEAFSFNFNPQSKREIKKIIYEHFEYIVSEWNKYFIKS